MITVKEKLYIANIDDLKEDWKENIKKLPAWRINRVNSFKVENPQKLSYLASILYIKAVNNIDKNIDINNITIVYKNEKPFINDPIYKDIYFNISHSGKKVILAISKKDVGCDIERIKDFDMNLVKRFFTKKEYELLDSVKDKYLQKKIFYKIWTFKESFLKLTSDGIVKSINNIDFSDVDYDITLSKEYTITNFINNGEKYYLHNLYDDEYMITICTKSTVKFEIII